MKWYINHLNKYFCFIKKKIYMTNSINPNKCSYHESYNESYNES